MTSAMVKTLYLFFHLVIQLVHTKSLEQKCGIWFAESSIPNSGLGMYAGRDFEKGEQMMEGGDVVIPIIDIHLHQGSRWYFLWDSYTWNAEALWMDSIGSDVVDAASPGFGSAANSFRDLFNVEEWIPDYSLAGLHRKKDAGAGAFSPYHNRVSSAKIDILEGEELFVSYGDNWFLERSEDLGPIPIRGDLPKATRKLLKWHRLRKQFNNTLGSDNMLKDLWETFVWNSPFADVSREFFSLPKNWEETEEVIKLKSLIKHRRRQSTRKTEWLREHGICGDNIKEGISTINQAGRGAFATRDLSKGTIIAPLPLIHLSNRTRMDMYKRNGSAVIKESPPVGKQLLLNYCMGHRDSTLLLCPYGLLTALINHGGKERSNVKLRWSDPSRSNHQPEWLNKTIKELRQKKSAILTMELVALRDISEGEEVLMDYGDEWEAAWTEHTKAWKPVSGAETYVSSEELNTDMDSLLKTEFEEMESPYPSNVKIMFDQTFLKNSWKNHLKEGTLSEYKKEAEGDLLPCDILRWKEDEDGNLLYTAVYFDEEKEKDEQYEKVVDVPREAFIFVDKPYTSDFLQDNVFRHDIRIPDEIFPDTWKNFLKK
mmetsp:Transcript_17515/g.26592  ORF Transcript_17515/g.26592 Transcript_17515/m.26592 type:complete len:598 (+) Transcript_17515:47-1840(+)